MATDNKPFDAQAFMQEFWQKLDLTPLTRAQYDVGVTVLSEVQARLEAYHITPKEPRAEQTA